MPPGTYRIHTRVPGMTEDAREVALASAEDVTVAVGLLPPDGTPGNEGCPVSGCAGEFLCRSGGACSECDEVTQSCSTGLTCARDVCTGEVPLCAPCAGDWQCGATGRCEVIGDGTRTCTYPCEAGSACSLRAFACTEGTERCGPDVTHFTGCAGYRAAGSPCLGTDDCAARGLVNAQCRGQRCTYGCLRDEECVPGEHCEDDAGLFVCKPL